MPKRIIFSLYIDIPFEDLANDPQTPHHGEDEDKNLKAKRLFKQHAGWLRVAHERYAECCQIDYRFFEYDEDYIMYYDMFREKYPQITTYNIINFYKIHLMYKLAEEGYDQILYLDLDVVPFTTENFFEAIDVDEGIAIKINNVNMLYRNMEYLKKNEHEIHSNRSPIAKYWNTRAMLYEYGTSYDIEGAFNTGIVGISSKHLQQLGYFDDFKETLGIMSDIVDGNEGMWPPITDRMFGWDNETIWGYKTVINSVPYQLLDSEWHHFMDISNKIPYHTKLAHIINKNFDFAKENYEKANNF